jgi:hypothetical protein
VRKEFRRLRDASHRIASSKLKTQGSNCSVIFNSYGLEGIERDFNLLGIETHSISFNLYGLEEPNKHSAWIGQKGEM